MKKTVILLGFVLALCLPLAAQDTIHIRDMRLINRYFVPDWIDVFPTYVDPKGVEYTRGWIHNYGEDYPNAKEYAEYMYTDDTLQVYGIAASLSTMWRLYPYYYASQIQSGAMDTSCEYLYNYLRLYEADPDSLRPVGEDLLVHLRYTPVSYYIDLDLFDCIVGNAESYTVRFQPVLPMYERYFSVPVPVADSFYVGRRYRTEHFDGRHVILPYLGDTVTHGREHWAWYLDYEHYSEAFDTTFVHHGWEYCNSCGPRWNFPFLFPIIAPPDTVGDTIIIPGDTIINPGDTIIIPGTDTTGIDTIGVGLRGAGLIYRYTTLQPNPATDRVRVLSSFGITAIEVYDLRGRLVYTNTFKHSHIHTFTLDLSSWPRGTYLLRILTPAGPTTKKLLIQ